MQTKKHIGTRIRHIPTLEEMGVPSTEFLRWTSIELALRLPSEGQYHCCRKLNTSAGSHTSISPSNQHFGHIPFVGNLEAIVSSLDTIRRSLSAASCTRRTFTELWTSQSRNAASFWETSPIPVHSKVSCAKGKPSCSSLQWRGRHSIT